MVVVLGLSAPLLPVSQATVLDGSTGGYCETHENLNTSVSKISTIPSSQQESNSESAYSCKMTLKAE